MENERTGTGRVQPLDAAEFMEISLTETNGEIETAAFSCSENEILARCGETLCRLLPGHPVTDLFLTDNKIVYYNIEPPLQRSELWLASMAVLAAKRAAADWCRKNGAPVPAAETGCNCFNETDRGGQPT